VLLLVGVLSAACDRPAPVVSVEFRGERYLPCGALVQESLLGDPVQVTDDQEQEHPSRPNLAVDGRTVRGVSPGQAIAVRYHHNVCGAGTVLRWEIAWIEKLGHRRVNELVSYVTGNGPPPARERS
jgi:hypothetical protein